MTTTKALVVEPDEKSRQIIDEVLLAIGHKYEIATSLAGAHELLAANGYAYVLLNCMIPARPGGMPRRQNAENFLDDLMRIKGGSMPPVIIMFDPMPEVDEETKFSFARELTARGASRFIRKPFRTEGRTLDRVIKKMLSGQREAIICDVPLAPLDVNIEGSETAADAESASVASPAPASQEPMSTVPGKVKLTAAKQEPPVTPGFGNLADPQWASVPNEAVEIDDFMARFCEQRSKENRMYRKRALLAAARHGTVTLPPLAGPRKHGQPNRYFVHDLLSAWQGFLDEGVDLPPLRPQSAGSYKGVDHSRGTEAATEASPTACVQPAGLKAAAVAVRV